jgi:hypothetical protein
VSDRVPIVLRDRLQVGKIGLTDPNPLSPITLENTSGARIVIGVADSSIVLADVSTPTSVALAEMYRGAPGPAGPPGPGTTITLQSAIAFPAFLAIGYGATGLAMPADPTQPNSYSFVGVNTNAADDINDFVEIVTTGVVTNPAWNFVPRKPVFVGENGELTQVIPSNPGNISHAIGSAQSPVSILVRPYFPVRL